MINLNIINDQIDSRLPVGDLSGIKLRECNWAVKTAGPSPYDNYRTELFFLGCNKALEGNPCMGCFNSSTWDSSKAQWSHDPVKMAKHINNNAPNKYITIGGGEPTDQIENLIILCKELKKYGFHIMIYTWKELEKCITIPTNIFGDALPIFKSALKIKELLKYVDIVVDGEFKIEERLWDGTKGDGLISSVGSGNQIVWDINNKIGYAMRDIKSLKLQENNILKYETNKLNNKLQLGGF